MKVHKFKRDVATLLTECNDAIDGVPGSDYLIRLLAVRNVLSGGKTADVAQVFNVTPAAVSLWVKTVDTDGPEALITKHRSGRPKKLSKEQLQFIDDALKKPASEADSSYSVWDSVTLSDFIKKKFNIDMSDRNCLRIFRELGFSQIRPQMYPSKGHEDEEARKEFLKKNASSSKIQP